MGSTGPGAGRCGTCVPAAGRAAGPGRRAASFWPRRRATARQL